MPKVTAYGQTFECDRGSNLRQVLLEQGIPLYNGKASIINCHGLGTCGTCAVQVEGEVSEPNWRDRARRSLPPHKPSKNLRLACQTQVLGDVRVTKFDGMWGQGDRRVWEPDKPTN
ncbi:MAG: (2Fe-2S)-binding protein [Cyanobacteria bacterium SID2]|nr:(2Fe-2S)-binding protein [Cyanobacteria bacterium SID2]